MNKLVDIRNNYSLSNKDLASLFNVHPNTIGNMLERVITDLSLNYVILLHQHLNIPYNTLLGETIFTPNNIEKRPNINILENTSQNNRTFEELKNNIKNELKVELLEELKELNKK